jgi:3-oxoacyl-[acyl-carrier protein] reductase
MSLEGEVALVTGASRGIGAAIAKLLGKQGAWVIGTATSASGAENVTLLLERQGSAGRGAVLNVADRDSVDALFSQLAQEERMPTVLINNAGITRDNILMRMKDEEWEAVLNTDLTGIYRLSRACARHMIKARRGCIINIASVVGAMGNAGQTNYCAAKAGVVGFTKALAHELGSRDITVNAVAPGFIDTDMTRGVAQEQRDRLISNIPLQRLGRTEEVAAAVAFLASPDAKYITGQTVHVNGGLYMA